MVNQRDNQMQLATMGDDNNVEVNIPFHLFTGRVTDAVYTDQNVPSYQSNPLIEALPPIFAEQRALIKELIQQPVFTPDLHNLSVGDRIHCVHDLEDQFFQPLPHHLSLQIKIDCMIRRGYVMRNPIQPGFYRRLQEQVELLSSESPLVQRPCRSKAYGFNLIGPSGIGKSYSLESLLYLYPQRIDHTIYQKQRFTQRQLVWLKMDCPFDGSLKALALNFFTIVDGILKTNYSRAYARSRRVSVDDLLRDMARVAALHFLGTLVIDEIQVLRAMRSENSARVLNFFVNLVNTIGVPVLLIGTSKARRLFEGDPRQARRSTGQGAEVWELMRLDRNWQVFLKALFKYQYVKNVVELSDDLSVAFFDETQGITDLVVKLYVQSQIRAMTSGIEMLTPEIVRSVALDSFQMLRPIIVALRHGDKRALAELEDVYPIWRTEYGQWMMQQPTSMEDRPIVSIATEATKTIAGNLMRKEIAPAARSQEASVANNTMSAGQRRHRHRPTSIQNNLTYPPDSLMGVIQHGTLQDMTPYHALQQAGHIFSFESYTKLEME